MQAALLSAPLLVHSLAPLAAGELREEDQSAAAPLESECCTRWCMLEK
jgi:hypothetical protein